LAGSERSDTTRGLSATPHQQPYSKPSPTLPSPRAGRKGGRNRGGTSHGRLRLGRAEPERHTDQAHTAESIRSRPRQKTSAITPAPAAQTDKVSAPSPVVGLRVADERPRPSRMAVPKSDHERDLLRGVRPTIPEVRAVKNGETQRRTRAIKRCVQDDEPCRDERRCKGQSRASGSESRGHESVQRSPRIRSSR